MNQPSSLAINPQRVAVFLLVLMGLVLLASVVTQSLFHLTGNLSWRGIAMFLDVSRERNVPTAFSTCLLLLASSLTAFVSVLEYRRPIDVGDDVTLVVRDNALWLLARDDVHAAAILHSS